MILYNYKAQNINGCITTGQFYCGSENELLKYIKGKGLFLISFKVINSKKSIFSRRPSMKQLALLCEYFYSLMSSGINMVETLNIIETQINNSPMKKSLRYMANMVTQGKQISNSMRMYPHIYPQLLVNMVTIGEESGRLDDVFKKLSILYYKENVAKNKVIKALIYPCALFLVSVLTVQMMIIFIVPTFMNMLISLNAKIPRTTRFIFDLGSFVNRNILVIFLTLIIITIFIFKLKKVEEVKRYIYSMTFRNKLIKKLLMQINGIRFSRYFGLLISSGIQVIDALEITLNNSENSFVREKLKRSIELVNGGESLYETINSTNIYPKLLCSMIRVGEETGNLDSLLVKSSEILEEELYNIIDKIIVLIEPLMIILLSAVIGIIIISFIMPMFSIMDSI